MREQCCFRRRQWMSKVERGTVLGLLAFALIYPRTIELSTQENNTSNLISLNEHVSRPALVLATSASIYRVSGGMSHVCVGCDLSASSLRALKGVHWVNLPQSLA